MLHILTSLLVNPYLGAGFGLVWFGTLISFVQTIVNYLVSLFRRKYLMTVEIHSNDQCYEWFIKWLASIKINTQNLSVKTIYNQRDNGQMLSDISFIPGLGSHYFKYQSYWIQMMRNRPSSSLDFNTGSSSEFITLNTFGNNVTIFRKLMNDARACALNDLQESIVLYKAMGTIWQAFGTPHKKRSMSSVILDEGVAEGLVNDVKEFIQSSQWYTDRGIPYRRGYLLYGSPGSGKSSFIKALAGVLNYSICVLNLCERDLSDSVLSELLSVAPERSIIVLEDVDAAFSSRSNSNHQGEIRPEKMSPITFSGLLNSLDGIIASEARIIFMTTNYIDRLDPALVRPGRVDVKQLVGFVSDYQLVHMYRKFYPQSPLHMSQQFKTAFREAIVDKQASPAHIQGYFMLHKNDPSGAIEQIKTLDIAGNRIKLSEDKIKLA